MVLVVLVDVDVVVMLVVLELVDVVVVLVVLVDVDVVVMLVVLVLVDVVLVVVPSLTKTIPRGLFRTVPSVKATVVQSVPGALELHSWILSFAVSAIT